MQSKVSVIIPTYNHERFIGAALESVLNQTHQNFELIVINDGSTDRSGEIIQSYRDERIIYRDQEKQDAYNTLNRGLGMVSGEYVAILNSDDVYSPDRLERLITEQQATGAQCLFSDVAPISDDGVEFIDPEILNNHHITLYSLDCQNGQAVFVETTPEADLYQAPFFYQAQRDNAVRVLTVPFEIMIQLARCVTRGR